MPVRLLVRRPSPTTASFTVSNASSRSSPSAKFLLLLQVLLRALLLVCVLLAAIAKLRHTSIFPDGLKVHWETIQSSPLGAFVCRIADSYSSWAIATTNALVVYGVFRKGYTGASEFRCVYVNDG